MNFTIIFYNLFILLARSIFWSKSFFFSCRKMQALFLTLLHRYFFRRRLIILSCKVRLSTALSFPLKENGPSSLASVSYLYMLCPGLPLSDFCFAAFPCRVLGVVLFVLFVPTFLFIYLYSKVWIKLKK